METIQQVFKDHPGIFHVAIGEAGAVALGAAFWFIMARLLDPGAYGEVNWLISVAIFVSTFCTLGLRNTIITYYPKEEREELVNETVTVVLVASLLAGIAIGLFIGPLVGLLVFGLSLFSVTISYELGRRRYKRYMWIRMGTRLMALPLALTMYLWLGMPGVLFGFALPILVFTFPSLKRLRGSNPSVKEVKDKAGFALRAFGADVTIDSTGLLDKILIGSLFGMITLGLYQLAYQIFMALSVLPGTLFHYLLPEKSAGTKTKGVETLGIFTSVLLATAIFLLSPSLIPLIFPGFVESVRMIQIMGLAVIPHAIAMTKMSELYAKERPGIVFISYLLALVVGTAGIFVLGTYIGRIGLAASVILLQTKLAISLLVHARG